MGVLFWRLPDVWGGRTVVINDFASSFSVVVVFVNMHLTEVWAPVRVLRFLGWLSIHLGIGWN